jgi:hypothetical protein
VHHNKAFGGAEEGGARADTAQHKGEKMQKMGEGRERREMIEMEREKGRREGGGGGGGKGRGEGSKEEIGEGRGKEGWTPERVGGEGATEKE